LTLEYPTFSILMIKSVSMGASLVWGIPLSFPSGR
jgi:hypothetical protein